MRVYQKGNIVNHKLSKPTALIVYFFALAISLTFQGFTPNATPSRPTGICVEKTESSKDSITPQGVFENISAQIETKSTNELTGLEDIEEDEPNTASKSTNFQDEVIQKALLSPYASLLLFQKTKLYILYCSLLIHLI